MGLDSRAFKESSTQWLEYNTTNNKKTTFIWNGPDVGPFQIPSNPSPSLTHLSFNVSKRENGKQNRKFKQNRTHCKGNMSPLQMMIAGNSLYTGRLCYRMCSCQSTVGLTILSLCKFCFLCTKSLFYSCCIKSSPDDSIDFKC